MKPPAEIPPADTDLNDDGIPWASIYGPRRVLVEEAKLRIAVLEAAVSDYRAGTMRLQRVGRLTGRSKRNYDEAVDWIKSKDCHTFSFEFIATEILRYSPNDLRREILDGSIQPKS